MRRAEIEREICRQNENAEREAELDRIKAQLWRRFSAAMREISGVAGKSHQATVQKSRKNFCQRELPDVHAGNCWSGRWRI